MWACFSWENGRLDAVATAAAKTNEETQQQNKYKPKSKRRRNTFSCEICTLYEEQTCCLRAAKYVLYDEQACCVCAVSPACTLECGFTFSYHDIDFSRCGPLAVGVLFREEPDSWPQPVFFMFGARTERGCEKHRVRGHEKTISIGRYKKATGHSSKAWPRHILLWRFVSFVALRAVESIRARGLVTATCSFFFFLWTRQFCSLSLSSRLSYLL